MKIRVKALTVAKICCVAGGFLLYGVLELAGGGGRLPSETESLKREAPGGGETCYEVMVAGLDEADRNKKVPVKIPVRERRYTAKEEEELFEGLLPELEKQILGENQSLEEVRQDLNLKSSLEGYGVSIRWESEEPKIVDSFGTVYNEQIPEKGEQVILNATVTGQQKERSYEIPIRVLPKELSREERLADEFQQLAVQMDLEQQTRGWLSLPSVYQGRALTYYLPEYQDNRLIPFLGLVAAALLQVQEKTKKQREEKRREELLLLDYSEIVSKLLVFVGAGLTVRGAWERITKAYEEGVRQGKREARPAYDEMAKTAAQLASGQAESRAYSEYGRRCGLQPYLKLSALLEQNRKTGSRQLRPALELEMVSAFEQRKNLAKKLGEEAGTRLLLPLLMMLGVVLVMIVVPAFLSFY